mmetsp:Transcript_85035/g.216625  ORF Transcript_85035/g.216625 Transcript_85035/m.216625 type:complete len:204 (+) Transcript_85035:80-691(+)
MRCLSLVLPIFLDKAQRLHTQLAKQLVDPGDGIRIWVQVLEHFLHLLGVLGILDAVDPVRQVHLLHRALGHHGRPPMVCLLLGALHDLHLPPHLDQFVQLLLRPVVVCPTQSLSVISRQVDAMPPVVEKRRQHGVRGGSRHGSGFLEVFVLLLELLIFPDDVLLDSFLDLVVPALVRQLPLDVFDLVLLDGELQGLVTLFRGI